MKNLDDLEVGKLYMIVIATDKKSWWYGYDARQEEKRALMYVGPGQITVGENTYPARTFVEGEEEEESRHVKFIEAFVKDCIEAFEYDPEVAAALAAAAENSKKEQGQGRNKKSKKKRSSSNSRR
jgi:hypothetical protein